MDHEINLKKIEARRYLAELREDGLTDRKRMELKSKLELAA